MLKKLFETCEFIPNFDIQMKRRESSVVFWNALKIRKSNAPYIEIRKFLKSLLLCGTDGFKILDYSGMNFGKRICC